MLEHDIIKAVFSVSSNEAYNKQKRTSENSNLACTPPHMWRNRREDACLQKENQGRYGFNVQSQAKQCVMG